MSSIGRNSDAGAVNLGHDALSPDPKQANPAQTPPGLAQPSVQREATKSEKAPTKQQIKFRAEREARHIKAAVLMLSGNLAELKAMHYGTEPLDPNCEIEQYAGSCLMMMAARQPKATAEMLDFLRKIGGDPNKVDPKDGSTPQHEAAVHGDLPRFAAVLGKVDDRFIKPAEPVPMPVAPQIKVN